jgi:hypothetical protein
MSSMARAHASPAKAAANLMPARPMSDEVLAPQRNIPSSTMHRQCERFNASLETCKKIAHCGFGTTFLHSLGWKRTSLLQAGVKAAH